MADVNDVFAEAVARHQAGDLPAAEQLYRAILAQVPGHAPTLCNLGVVLVRAGRFDEAARLYNLALASTPGYPDAHFNLGNLHRRAGQFGDAEQHYRACLAANPDHASAAYNLGISLSAVGHPAAAADYFALVVKLEPDNADAHARLGDALVRSARQNDGIAAFRKSVELRPNDHRGLYNLALALSNAGQTTDAGECIQKALKLKPDYAEAHNALGLNLEALGRKDDALFHYQEAVRLKPDLSDGWSNLGTNLAEQGRTEEAINCLRESLTIKPNVPPIFSNLLLLLNYPSDLDPTAVRDEHFAWAAKFGSPTPDAPPVPTPHNPDRRLRIGYLSGDFRGHTVAGFIRALLTHHDRDRVEVVCYSSVHRPDETTEQLRQLADQWRPVGGLPDERVYDLVRGDRIDVLIDLSGHTAGNRMLVLAARPAPVQATLFGYPNTTGLSAVDYRISDSWSDPPGMTDHLYAEAVLRLPDVAWVYAPPTNAPAVGPLPGASRRTFTFGCLNNPAKISDACLDTWAKILQSTPGSRLVMLAGQSKAGAKRLSDRLIQAGILRDRIEMVFRLPKEQYFESYNQFDVALDPFPYNGGVTTCDALWMGVPVLAVAGTSYVARQGGMLMNAVGLGEFIADSPESLVKLAKAWTTRRPELATIRAELRERLRTSPVCDAANYVRNLEATLREAWRKRLPSDERPA